MANICERVGAEVIEVMAASVWTRASDGFLNAGIGWAELLWQDILAAAHGREYGIRPHSGSLTGGESNAAQRGVQKLQEKLHSEGQDHRVTGTAFKPNTDLRTRPDYPIAEKLIQMGPGSRHDRCDGRLREQTRFADSYCDDALAAAEHAIAVLVRNGRIRGPESETAASAMIKPY